MSWALFLDDLRDIGDDARKQAKELGLKIKLARNNEEAKTLCNKLGMPQHIFFDHDLGGDERAIDFAKWLIDCDLDAPRVSHGDRIRLPDNFTYTIHSANPVGAENIKGLIDSYLEFRKRLSDTRP